jgi:hypothetical protein
MCPAFFKIEIQYLSSENTVSVPFSYMIWFDTLGTQTEKNLAKRRDLQWIGVHVSGKCGCVKREKPAYPNWLNRFRPAQKDRRIR